MALHKLQSMTLSPIRAESSQMDSDESFALEDGLGIFRRFEATAQSCNASDRQNSMRNMIDVVRAVDYYGADSHFELFFQIICDLGQDVVLNVRCVLLERFPSLFLECRQSRNLDPYVERYLTPFITSQLSANETVRKAALDVIGVLLEQRLFSQESLKNLLVPTLFLTLETPADPEDKGGCNKDELRLETCTVICRVVSMQNVDDREWIFHNYVPKFSCFLQECPAFHIRKAAIQIFGELAKMFREGFTEAFIVPHFVALSEDSNWGVRKAVCEVFVDVAAYVSPKMRREVLVPTFLKLLHDKNRWVNIMAGQELGPFIATFADGTLTGLALHNGKVVPNDGSNTKPKEDRQFSILPDGCYLPEHVETFNKSQSFDDSVREILMFEKWQRNNQESPNSSFSPGISGVAATGRCSSSDDLSKFGIDDDYRDLNEHDENDEFDSDDSDPLNCSVLNGSDDANSSGEDSTAGGPSDASTFGDQSGSSKSPIPSMSPVGGRHTPESPNVLTYWSANPCITDDIDFSNFGGLSYFGSSHSSANESTSALDENFLARRMDVLQPHATTSVDNYEKLDMDISAEGISITDSEMDISDELDLRMQVEGEEIEDSVGADRTQDDSMEMDISVESSALETSWEQGRDLDASGSSDTTLNESVEMDISVSDTSSTSVTETDNTLNTTAGLFNHGVARVTPSHDDTLSVFQHLEKACEDTGFEFCDPTGASSSAGSSQESQEEQPEDELSVLKEFVPTELVECFVRDVDEGSDTVQSDYNRHRAHSFPAVAFTLGHKHWALLRDTYSRLANDGQMRVRSSLAASMHEMAAIVGPHNSRTDLVPVFVKFREDVEEVRSGLLTNLYEFFERLPGVARLEMLHDLPHMLRIDNEANWRFRKEFASQCGKLCSLYDIEAINKGISGIALTLCSDRVAEVREEAALLTARILGMMVRHEWHDDADEAEDTGSMPYTNAFVQDIVRGFARSRTAKRRMTFATICECCLRESFLDKIQFCSLLLDHLTLMAADKVVGVRLSVCHVLDTAGEMPTDISQLQVEDVLSRLAQCDVDIDVKRTARIARNHCCKRFADKDSLEVVDLDQRAVRIRLKEEEFFSALSDRIEKQNEQDTNCQGDESTA